jgi:hypothetical protein
MTKPRYLPSGVLSRQAARRVLRPYQGLLGRVVMHAWDGWETLGRTAPAVRAETGNLTRASVMSDLMTREALRLFKPIRSVDVNEPYGRAALWFGQGDLILSFHKIELDSIPDPRTDRQFALWSQEAARTESPLLPGFGTGTRADVGYLLNETGTRITQIVVRCATDGVTDWIIELPTPGVVTTPVQPIVAPTPPASKISSSRKDAAGERPSASSS